MNKQEWAKDFSVGIQDILSMSGNEKENYIIKFCNTMLEKYPDMTPESFQLILNLQEKAESELAKDS